MFFEALSSGFQTVVQKIRGYETLSEENLRDAFEFMRKFFLDRNVDYKFTKSFLDEVYRELLGQVVNLKGAEGDKIDPGDYFLALCKKKLLEKLYRDSVDFEKYLVHKPTKILMVGLQGTGKTTQSAKLALHIQKVYKRSVGLVSCDDQRPAAAEQLKVLSGQAEAEFWDLQGQDPLATARHALENSTREVLIFDTAGRLTIDEESMQRVKTLQEAVQPHQTILVVDALMGQQAVNVAHMFNQRLKLDGVLVTKFDADQQGGAALSILAHLQLPIYFLGVGEGLHDLMTFHLPSLIDNMFGAPDIKGAIESVEKLIDRRDEEELQAVLMSGQINFYQFLKIMKQMTRLAEAKLFFAKLGFSKQDMSRSSQAALQFHKKYQAFFDSMTPKERLNPALLLSSPTARSRIRRISKGSGLLEKDIQNMLNSFSMLIKTAGLFKLISQTGAFPKHMSPQLMKKISHQNPMKAPKKKDLKNKYKNR